MLHHCSLEEEDPMLHHCSLEEEDPMLHHCSLEEEDPMLHHCSFEDLTVHCCLVQPFVNYCSKKHVVDHLLSQPLATLAERKVVAGIG